MNRIVQPSVILETMAKIEGREKHTCDLTCRYWKFPHRDKACILSDVFSVRKGEMCAEYEQKIGHNVGI